MCHVHLSHFHPTPKHRLLKEVLLRKTYFKDFLIQENGKACSAQYVYKCQLFPAVVKRFQGHKMSAFLLSDSFSELHRAENVNEQNHNRKGARPNPL